jgi:hypothetical protein
MDGNLSPAPGVLGWDGVGTSTRSQGGSGEAFRSAAPKPEQKSEQSDVETVIAFKVSYEDRRRVYNVELLDREVNA